MTDDFASEHSDLNHSAWLICQQMRKEAGRLGLELRKVGGAEIWDFGIESRGGLDAGRLLAELCLGGRGTVELVPASADFGLGIDVVVRSDEPVLACLGSQYAGWKIDHAGYFAMASGPMRLLAGHEELLEELGFEETSSSAVGVLETGAIPSGEVCQWIANTCGLSPSALTLCAAPTRSLSGTLQIVARSLETTLHKLHYLKFDVTRVVCGWGAAPLPPPAADDLTAIGWTNDAILYGGRSVLWLRDDDSTLDELSPRIASSASRDYGQPFAELFKRYGGDFYQIDPLLFSPAQVTLVNLNSGRTFRAGHVNWDLLRASWGCA